jgi:DNA-binding SARP family transcriptional activator/ATP/maltotriose-dependent transcriptional regulator MalT
VSAIAGPEDQARTALTSVGDRALPPSLGLGSRERRLVTITAAAGWGKTTTAGQQAPWTGRRWLTITPEHRDPLRLAQDLAATAGGEAPEADVADLARKILGRWSDADVEVVVLDDAHLLVGSDAVRLLREVTAPERDGPQVVVLSRVDLGLVDAHRRATGRVLELDAKSLALTLDQVADLVATELVPDRALAARLVDASRGWPALIRLLIEAIRPVAPADRSGAVDGASSPRGPVGNYLESVVLAEEPDDAWQLLARLALLGSADRRLVASSGGHPRSLDDLVSRGLIVADPDAPDRLRLAPAMQRVVEEVVVPRMDPTGDLVDDLATSLLTEPDVAAALLLLTRRGRTARAAALLEEHGRWLLREGRLSVVAEVADGLSGEERTPAIQRLQAEALAFLGDWVKGLDLLQLSGFPAEGTLDPAVALQAGLIHHLRGDLETALATYGRAELDGAPPDSQTAPTVAALHAWTATARWLRGSIEEARESAAQAMRFAVTQHDDQALALAHTAAALLAASDGDRHANEDHYRQALHAAQRAGDRLQEARILTNWGSHHLEEGDYEDALTQTEEAIDLAERTGFAMIAGIALCNRAEILVRTGQLDQAIADAERGREILAAIGARTEAYAHHLLGAARTERGELALAQQAFERALRIATPAGDRQALVPAYLGLASVLASSDLEEASEAAATALDLDGGMLRPEAHLAMAWVASAQGEVDACREHAIRAREEATSRDNALAVAEATTCLALLDDDPVPGLREARLLWEQLDTPLWTTRVDLAIALRSAENQEQARIEWLERRLAGWGSPMDRGSVAHRLLLTVEPVPRTSIRALGGFVAEREGRPLTSAEWGSRKAQDLVKILVVRTGRGVSREEIAHLLWPDQAYDEVSNRLSVALSLARSALSGEHDTTPIVTQGTTVRLDPSVVDLDVDAFSRVADDALRAARDTDPAQAIPLLIRAEEMYGGDLLEDDLDVDWVIDRRLSLRTTYLDVARTIARLASADDPDLAIRMLLRVLDRDGYDEPAHLNLCLALLRNGRYGEARRRFRVYETRMRELDLPVVPFHELRREAEQTPQREAS